MQGITAKRIIIPALSCLVLILLGYRVLQYQRIRQETAVKPMAEEGAFPVVVAKVVRGNLEEMISMAGTVVPKARVEVFSRASGQVQQVKVKEGDTVHRNDLLAVVQGKDGEPVSVVSPIAGVIAQRSCEPGGIALAMEAANSEALFVVEDIEAVKVQVGLPEMLVPVVRVGEEARVRVEAYPLDHYPLALFKGRITSVSPSLDVGSRTARAEVTIDNRDGRLKPGMFAMVGLVREQLKNVLLVPKEAVIAGDESDMVYVVKDNIVQERQVQIGASDGRWMQILNPERSQNPSMSGEHTAFRPKGSVEEGDEVVTIGARMVYNGQKVRVIR
jgi:multidrug efflux pump subunit AcrA (membrane-fusion protein)